MLARRQGSARVQSTQAIGTSDMALIWLCKGSAKALQKPRADQAIRRPTCFVRFNTLRAPRNRQLHTSSAQPFAKTKIQSKTKHIRHSSSSSLSLLVLHQSDLRNEQTENTQLSSGRASATHQHCNSFAQHFCSTFSLFFPLPYDLEYRDCAKFSLTAQSQIGKRAIKPDFPILGSSTAQLAHLQASELSPRIPATSTTSTAQHSRLAKASASLPASHCHC
ncbi:hypothetical protein GGI43DRAFT_170143 [Trichoderma evansii]